MSEKKYKTIDNCTAEEVKTFFLKHQVYINNAMPVYYDFSEMLNKIFNIVDQYDNKKERKIIEKYNKMSNCNFDYYGHKNNTLSRKFSILNPILIVLLTVKKNS